MAVRYDKPAPGSTAFPKSVKVKDRARLVQRNSYPRKKRPGPPRKVDVVRDEPFKDFVRALPCLLAERGECWHSDLRDPDHAAKKTAMGRVEDDTSCIPLCRRHHSDRHDHRGYFKLWDRERMEKWRTARIDETRQAYDDFVARSLSAGSRRTS